jgi:alanine dehydrogenase
MRPGVTAKESKPMRVGIPREVKPAEYRVAGTPAHVRRLSQIGCQVIVQRGAGLASGYTDEEYQQAGADLADALPAVYERADLMWKVKEILPEEYDLVRPDHVIFTYLHAAPRAEMTRVLRDAGCIAIAYEEVTDDKGRRPLLEPMSRLAGAGAIALAAQYLQAPYGGAGKLLFHTEGAEPVTVLILGGGTAGRAAARAALGAGARVYLLELLPNLVYELTRSLPDALVLPSTAETIRRLLPETDVLLNCTFWLPGDPRLIYRDMLSLIQPGSLIVDVAADPNGAVETSVETTLDDPIRVVDGVLHCCVQNIPSLFARTASEALAAVTWPLLERIVRDGVATAVAECPALRRGVVLWRGKAAGQQLAKAQGVETITSEQLLAELSPPTK